jgi:branched-chain amino acid transport system ATP-binding protein
MRREAPALALSECRSGSAASRPWSDVSFTVPERSIFGLIGPNGAGKTTVFNLVTGVYKPTSAASVFHGKTWAGSRAQIARLGVARTFQNIRLFQQLTVLENVLVACENTRKAHLGAALLRSPLFFRDEAEMKERAMKLLAIFELDGWPTRSRPRCRTATSGAWRSPAR